MKADFWLFVLGTGFFIVMCSLYRHHLEEWDTVIFLILLFGHSTCDYLRGYYHGVEDGKGS